MDNKNKVDIQCDDFWIMAVAIMVLGAIIGGLVLMVIGFLRVSEKDDLRYKEALFLSASGQGQKVDTENQSLFKARAIGEYLKDEFKNGNALYQVIKKETELRFLLSSMGGAKEFYLFSQKQDRKIDERLIMMVYDNDWDMVKRNSEDLTALDHVLKGGAVGQIDYDYPLLSLKDLVKLLIVLQFIAFSGFLLEVKSNWHHFKRRRVPWEEKWVYITILLMSPGALPLLLPILTVFLTKGLSRRCRIFSAKREERKNRHIIQLGLDDSTYNSSAFIETLRRRLEKSEG